MSEDPNETMMIGVEELASLRQTSTAEREGESLVVALQTKVRELVARVSQLERDLLEANRRTVFERDNLLTRQREIDRERAIDRCVDAHLPLAVEVWRPGPLIYRRNGAASLHSGLADQTLEHDSLAELSEAIGLTRDSAGEEVLPTDWPLTRALRGEVVEGEMLVLRGRRLLVCAYPMDLRAHGEPQLWALLVYREVL